MRILRNIIVALVAIAISSIFLEELDTLTRFFLYTAIGFISIIIVDFIFKKNEKKK